MAAHLAGVVASLTTKPVVRVITDFDVHDYKEIGSECPARQFSGTSQEAAKALDKDLSQFSL